MKLTRETKSTKPRWKRMILAMVCLIGIIAIIGGSYAAYTSQASMRGVARNRDNEVMRFSSNYLENSLENAVYVTKTVLFSENQKNSTTPLSVDVFVYNYANGNKNLVNQKDITYTMSFTFTGGTDEVDAYSVIIDDDQNSKRIASNKNNSIQCTIDNQELIGRDANWHKYTVQFPAAYIDQLQITAKATPTDLSVTNNQILAAVIMPSTGTATNAFSYEGKFIYDTSVTNPQDYDGFNYEVSISSGKANATLTWQSDIVEIDKFFLVKLGKSDDEIRTILGGENNISTLKFTMDQAAGSGDYLIPFYIKDKSNIPKTWDGMNEVVTFEAKEDTSSDQTDVTE